MENDKGQRFELLIAVLIAVAAVIGALVAWRASVVADASGDEDYDGLRAALFSEETRALNHVNAYEHYGAFTTYTRYSDQGAALEAELEERADLSEEQFYQLDRLRADSYDLARANQDLFPSRFINREGTYNLEREMGEMWADASREKDLEPEPHFAEANRLRTKSNQMLGALAVLAISLVFYSLIESFEGRWKYILAVLGTLFLVGGTVLAIILEFSK
jgi:hypothetical protein